jgi:hypothetical protein
LKKIIVEELVGKTKRKPRTFSLDKCVGGEKNHPQYFILIAFS